MRFAHFRLVGPAVFGLALLLAAMATVTYYGVLQIDAEARQRQETLVERNIALWITDVEFSLTAWTIWDEAIAKIDNAYDEEWVDRNIGASLIGTSRTRFAAVLDPADRIVYSKTDGTVRNRPFFAREPAAILADAVALVADVRRREGKPQAEGIPQAINLSRIEVMGSEAVLLTAALFQPDFGTARPKGDRAPVLITAMPIAGSLENFFGQRFLLDDARVSRVSSVAPDRARAEIAMNHQGETEVLSWQPPTPAQDILARSLPFIVTVGLVLLAGGLFTIRIAQATAEMLVSRERQMRHAATHDFLTGLANRSLLSPEFRAMAAAGPLTVVCVDLDGFKGVNDTHGHAMGDELLKDVAAKLRAGIRETDRLFRLGGDEFAILMPGISIAAAQQACIRLSTQLSLPIALSKCEVSIAASFGLEHVANQQTGCEAALSAADAALYHAKSTGRGAVITSADMAAAPREPRARRKAPAWRSA